MLLLYSTAIMHRPFVDGNALLVVDNYDIVHVPAGVSDESPSLIKVESSSDGSTYWVDGVASLAGNKGESIC